MGTGERTVDLLETFLGYMSNEISGNSSTTINCSNKQSHIMLVNDGTNDITLTVNSKAYTVKPSDPVMKLGRFKDFTSFNITAVTNDYRVYTFGEDQATLTVS